MQESAHELPYSPACERNQAAIGAVLDEWLQPGQQVLEVGSGTGQHAVFFGRRFPEVGWQPTDTGDYLSGLGRRLEQEAPGNVAGPLPLDVRDEPWPVGQVDAVFSANTLHYMGLDCVQAFFCGVANVLRPGGMLLVYGPFNYAGSYTSDSNAAFDRWLQSSDPQRAIRDFEYVNELAGSHGMILQGDHELPANNRMVLWRAATGD